MSSDLSRSDAHALAPDDSSPAHYRPSISRITSDIFMGNSRSSYDRDTLQKNQITAIVSLIAVDLGMWQGSWFTRNVAQDHLWIPCLDTSTQDLLKHFEEICDFIDKVLYPPASQLDSAERDLKSPQSSPHVLVHCHQGISRSGTVVVAYLMRRDHKDLQDALAEVRSRRRWVKPSDNFMNQLRIWQEVRYEIWEDHAHTIPKKPYADYLDRRAALLKEKGLTGDEPIFPLRLEDITPTTPI